MSAMTRRAGSGASFISWDGNAPGDESPGGAPPVLGPTACRRPYHGRPMTDGFSGFRPEAFQFLVDLALNNDRSWFQPRKGDYERLLKEPLEALCVALAAEFEERSIPLSADPGRSPFRIYRDVRFSTDKSPTRPPSAQAFRGPAMVAGSAATSISNPARCYVGGGMWHPAPARLAAWRARVVEDRGGRPRGR